MRARRVAFGALLLGTCAILTPKPVAAQGKEVEVTGEVRDAETGLPIRGASIVLVGSVRGALTDSAGRFRLLVPDGDWPHIYRVRHIGHREQRLQVVRSQELSQLETIRLLSEASTLWIDRAPTCEPLNRSVPVSDSTRRVDGHLEWQQMRRSAKSGLPERVLCRVPIGPRR